MPRLDDHPGFQRITFDVAPATQQVAVRLNRRTLEAALGKAMGKGNGDSLACRPRHPEPMKNEWVVAMLTEDVAGDEAD
jgi:hypothetical protein